MNSYSSILLSTLLIVLVNSYAIEGDWKVTHIGQEQPSQSHQIIATIQDFVFRNATIRWSISFKGCSKFKYQMQVLEDNLYINDNSFFRQRVHSCEKDELQLEGKLVEDVRRSFKFQIFSNFMLFSDYAGTVLLKFSRHSQISPPDLEGNWKIQRVYSEKVSQLLQIKDNKMSLCQRKINFNFEVPKKNKFYLSNITDDGCQSEQLMMAISEIVYFRREGSVLTFYSGQIKRIMILKFFLDLQAAEKQVQDQRRAHEQKLKAERAQQRRKEILRNREAERKQRAEENNNKNEVSTVSQKITNTSSDLLGKWKIFNIFGIPLPIDKLDFIISEDQIILSGGCNTHILEYKPENKQFRTGQIRSTKKICQNDEDGIYKRGLLKISSYQIQVKGDDFVLTILDEKGSLVYELRRKVQLVTVTSQAEKQTQNSRESTSVVSVIEQKPAVTHDIIPGRYMLLLLKRRDLPRKMITIKQETLTFKVCNRVTFSYQADEEQLILTLQNKEGAKNPCDLDRQNAYIEALQKIKRYQKQESDMGLFDESGQEIIYLNLVGS